VTEEKQQQRLTASEAGSTGLKEHHGESSVNIKLKLVLTKWLANNRTPDGVPYILLWDVGVMRFDADVEHILGLP